MISAVDKFLVGGGAGGGKFGFVTAGVFCLSLPGLPPVSYPAAHDALFPETHEQFAVFPHAAWARLNS